MIWIFSALLWAGILTMRIESRWALTAFETCLFTLAIVAIARQRLAVRPHPIGAILAAIALYGLIQVALGISVDRQKTLEASLHWVTNCAAFSLALHLSANRTLRRRFLTAQLVFILVTAIGAVIALFTIGSLGPFVYRNQFAAFLEPALGLAIAAAIGDRRRTLLWMLVAGALFAAVIAGASRAGSAICLTLLIAVPLFAYLRRAISLPSLLRVAALGAVSAFALVAIVGWETIWTRFQEPHPYSLRAELNRAS